MFFLFTLVGSLLRLYNVSIVTKEAEEWGADTCRKLVSTLKMEAIRSSKKSVHTLTTRRHNYRCEDLES
jgi:hypothetical protein